MRVGIATGHAGFAPKEELLSHLRERGHELVDIDIGAFTQDQGADCRDLVIPLAQAVARGKVERGVAVCGSKVPGIRAGLIHDHFSARQGVDDDDMNIICMADRVGGMAWGEISSIRSSERSSAAPSGIFAGCVMCCV